MRVGLELPKLEEQQLQVITCMTHYLARRFAPEADAIVGHPPGVPNALLARHFPEPTLAQRLAELAALRVVGFHSTDAKVVYLTEVGVQYLAHRGTIPAEFRHNFGDFETPELDDIEQLPDEDDDEFADRCSEAEAEVLDALDAAHAEWARQQWKTPAFLQNQLEPSDGGDVE